MPLLTTIYCFLLALFAWMAAAAEWPVSHGAATWIGLIGLVAAMMGLTVLFGSPWGYGG